MTERKIYVKVETDEKMYHENQYGIRINSVYRVNEYPCGIEIHKFDDPEQTQATILDEAFSFGISDPFNEHDCRFLVPAYSWAQMSENSFILEFDEDSYGKLIFVSKNTNIYLSFD